jgi:uncharacterized protein YrrD
MLVKSSEIIGSKIFSLQDGFSSGRLADLLIDRKSLKIVFLIIQAFTDKKYLAFDDMCSLDHEKILIKSFEDLSTKSDLVRFAEIIDQNIKLIKIPVETLSGKRLGRVNDFCFESLNPIISKIYVKNFMSPPLIISRNSIVEVSNKKIIIKDGFVPLSAKSNILLTRNS